MKKNEGLQNKSIRESRSTEDKKFKQGELKEILLSAIGISILLGGTFMITPNFPIVIGGIYKLLEEISQLKLKKNKKFTQKMHKTLKRLEKRQILSLTKNEDTIEVRVLDKGRTEVLKYSLKELLKRKTQKGKWQGKWYLVIFDVPENQRNKRNYLRNLLSTIGFIQYQQSVYIFPYQCEKEVQLIKKVVEGGEYIKYIIADRIEGEKELKRMFKIE